MRNKLIFAGIGLILFLSFLLLLLFILGKSQNNTQNNAASDENRVPTKALIENTQNIFTISPTFGPSPTESPIDLDYSQHIDDDEIIDKAQLQDNPDVYLFNKLPHEENFFSMTADLVDGGGGKIVFIVSIKSDPVQSKQAAETWMKSIGLSQEVITTLDITYQ